MNYLEMLVKTNIAPVKVRYIEGEFRVNYERGAINKGTYEEHPQGIGDTVNEAALDYIKQINGKDLLIGNPVTPDKRIFPYFAWEEKKI